MNAVLLVCSRCQRICGCTAPERKACGHCTSHDCPLLPAPQRVLASCDACKEKWFAMDAGAGISPSVEAGAGL